MFSIQPLRHAHHSVKLTPNFYKDIHWWLQFIELFNAKSVFPIPQLDSPVFIDACSVASGIFFNGDWLYTNFPLDWPEIKDLHINYKEVLSVVLAARRWAPQWANTNVTVFTDNITARAIINKGSCRHPLVMPYIRELFWLSAIYNFSLTAVHIAGSSNVMADTISRLHEQSQLPYLLFLLREWAVAHVCMYEMFWFSLHMSRSTFMFLLCSQMQLCRRWMQP